MKTINLIEENKVHDKFCILPFIGMQIYGDQISPCCKLHNVHSVQNWNLDIDRYFSNENIIEIQQGFLSDNISNKCKKCFIQDSSLYPSTKFIEYSMLVDNENINPNINKTQIQMLNVQLGNICNLQCRHCVPQCSSSIAKIWDTHIQSVTNVSNMAHVLNTDDLISELLSNPNFDNVTSIILSGGEPFMNIKLKDIITKFKNRGIKKIGIVTNASDDPFGGLDFFEDLSGIKKSITVSLDGDRQMHPYYRNLLDVTRFEQNCKKLKSSKTIKLMVLMSISAINIYNIPRAIEYAYELFDDDFFFNISIVENWYLSVAVLPKSELIHIIDFYEAEIKNFKFDNKNNGSLIKAHLSKIKSYVNRALHQKFIQKNLNAFCEYITLLDSKYASDFRSVNPRIAAIIDEYYLRASASNTSEAAQKELPQVVQFFPRA